MSFLLVFGLVFLLCLLLIFAAVIKVVAHAWQAAEIDDSPWMAPDSDALRRETDAQETVFNRFDLVAEPALELPQVLVDVPR
jgi:hypothetical protein